MNRDTDPANADRGPINKIHKKQPAAQAGPAPGGLSPSEERHGTVVAYGHQNRDKAVQLEGVQAAPLQEPRLDVLRQLDAYSVCLDTLQVPANQRTLRTLQVPRRPAQYL